MLLDDDGEIAPKAQRDKQLRQMSEVLRVIGAAQGHSSVV
jgi:hypothetical protein